MTAKDYMSTDEIIRDGLLELDRSGIPYVMGDYGAKRLARIKLVGGKSILVCVYRKTVRIGCNPAVKYKNLEKFLSLNSMKIAK